MEYGYERFERWREIERILADRLRDCDFGVWNVAGEVFADGGDTGLNITKLAKEIDDAVHYREEVRWTRTRCLQNCALS